MNLSVENIQVISEAFMSMIGKYSTDETRYHEKIYSIFVYGKIVHFVILGET